MAIQTIQFSSEFLFAQSACPVRINSVPSVGQLPGNRAVINFIVNGMLNTSISFTLGNNTTIVLNFPVRSSNRFVMLNLLYQALIQNDVIFDNYTLSVFRNSIVLQAKAIGLDWNISASPQTNLQITTQVSGMGSVVGPIPLTNDLTYSIRLNTPSGFTPAFVIKGNVSGTTTFCIAKYLRNVLDYNTNTGNLVSSLGHVRLSLQVTENYRGLTSISNSTQVWAINAANQSGLNISLQGLLEDSLTNTRIITNKRKRLMLRENGTTLVSFMLPANQSITPRALVTDSRGDTRVINFGGLAANAQPRFIQRSFTSLQFRAGLPAGREIAQVELGIAFGINNDTRPGTVIYYPIDNARHYQQIFYINSMGFLEDALLTAERSMAVAVEKETYVEYVRPQLNNYNEKRTRYNITNVELSAQVKSGSVVAASREALAELLASPLLLIRSEDTGELLRVDILPGKYVIFQTLENVYEAEFSYIESTNNRRISLTRNMNNENVVGNAQAFSRPANPQDTPPKIFTP